MFRAAFQQRTPLIRKRLRRCTRVVCAAVFIGAHLLACAPTSPAPRSQRSHIEALSQLERREYSEPQLIRTSMNTSRTLEMRESKEEAPAPIDASELGRRWLYGPGFGTSMLNVGTTIAFPPFALYLLGNAGLELAGLPTLYASSALPEKERSIVLDFYYGITSVPGRISALLAGEEYRDGTLDVTAAKAYLQEQFIADDERQRPDSH